MSKEVELTDFRKGKDNPGFVNDSKGTSLEDIDLGDKQNSVQEGKPVKAPLDRNGELEGRKKTDLEAQEEEAASEDEDADFEPNAYNRFVLSVQDATIEGYKTHETWIWRIVGVLLLVGYFVYFGFAMSYRFGDEGSIRLLVCTILGVFLLVMHLLRDYTDPCFDKFSKCLANNQKVLTGIRWFLYFALLVTVCFVLGFVVGAKTPSNLLSLAGLAAFVFLCYITSHNPARINWHPVIWGFGLQFIFALLILKTDPGYQTFKWLGDRVTEFLAYTNAGAKFVFGEKTYTEHYFAFVVLSTIIFFSTIISMLYYLGIMQSIIGGLGRFLCFCLGTTPAESLNAAGNIFVGMTEAPLMIKPFLDRMTLSELHAVMTGGFATIAGSVLGAYASFGVPTNHLLSASVMSAPAALAIAKLMYPETKKPKISDDDYRKMEKAPERNVIEAAYSGASLSIRLVANVGANVLAFLAVLAFVDATLEWFGDRVGLKKFTFEFVCSYVLYPVALFMGAAPKDCRNLAKLVGIKTFTNEFIAYGRMKILLQNHKDLLNYTQTFGNDSYWYWENDNIILPHWNNHTLVGGFMEKRTEVIATYALCGFSNFGSMGILLGGLVGLAPSRKADLSGIVFRAMIAGNIACFTTACIAGLFFDPLIDK